MKPMAIMTLTLALPALASCQSSRGNPDTPSEVKSAHAQDDQPASESTVTNDAAIRFAHKNFWPSGRAFIAADYHVEPQGDWLRVCYGAVEEPEVCDLVRHAADGQLESYFTVTGRALLAAKSYLIFAKGRIDGDSLSTIILNRDVKTYAAQARDEEVAASALRNLLGYSRLTIPAVNLVATQFASGDLKKWPFGYYVTFPNDRDPHPNVTLRKEERIRMVIGGFSSRTPEVCDGNPADMMADPRDFSTLPGGAADKSFQFCPWTHFIYDIKQLNGRRWVTPEFPIPRGPCLAWQS